MSDDPQIMVEMLRDGVSPSGTLWRYLEVQAVRNTVAEAPLQRPVMEVGCGDGTFTRLSVGYVDTAIDIDPHAVAKAVGLPEVYGEVKVADARQLVGEGYGTIFANCVLEHIPGVEGVIEGCAAALKPGGEMIATVPLSEMNHNLLWRSRQYAHRRQEQLLHHNLWTIEKWTSVFCSAGFSAVRVHPYLGGDLCWLWDALDAPTTLGFGRYRVGAPLRHWNRLPLRAREQVAGRLAPALMRAVASRPETDRPCAILIRATKIGDDPMAVAD